MQKPRLVPAGQGFSSLNTVEYKNRFLYSKYNPTQAIQKTLDSLTILPGTIVIACSPALWYGLETLEEKCGDTSMIIAFEADEVLCEFAKENLPKEKNIPLFSKKTLLKMDSLIREKTLTGNYRRVIRIDMSAGVQFEGELYSRVEASSEDIMASFWKSRVTITLLGRLFAKNIFKNLTLIKKSLTLSDVRKTVEKPILVCGAGESLDETLKDIKGMEKDFFILAVDASLSCLRENHICPHAAVGVESQLAIQKAYIGFKGNEFPVFLDICSRTQVARMFSDRVIWFCSEYAHGEFLKKIEENFFEGAVLPPLGSVGLSAVCIALALRKDDSIPIFVSGLDFSFSAGRTHAKSAPAELARLSSCTKIIPHENYSALLPPCFTVQTKDGSKMFTTPSMALYAKMFCEQFSGMQNVYDSGLCGLSLGIEQKKPQAGQFKNQSEKKSAFEIKLEEKNSSKNPRDFYRKEKEALLEIKDLLTNGENSSHREKTISLTQQLENLLKEREYLYLHFPDGYKLSMESPFLKRVRAELDPFLRIMEEGSL